MAEFLISVGTLAIILIGIAIMLQLTSVNEVLEFVGRALAALLVMILALCILKALWVGVMGPWLSTALEFLKTFAWWFVITTLAVVVLLIIGRVVLRRLARYLPLRRDPLTGEEYEIHDSKEEKD